MTRLRQQNGEDIGRKRTQGAVILLPSVFMFEIDAILTPQMRI
jgi:hypothetical protein